MDNQALKDCFKFEEADLNANRNGKLSEKQQKELAKEDKSSNNFTIGCGIVLLVIGLVLLFIFIPLAFSAWKNENITGSLAYLIPMAIGVLACGGFGVYTLFCMFFWKGEVKYLLKKVEGPVNLVGVQRQRSTGNSDTYTTYIQHEMHIGQETFDVEEKAAGLMMQGDIYAVYYRVNSDDKGKDAWNKKILSLEWVSKG
jgi:hypothetical protein